MTQFLSRRGDDALAALIERHAPMVWGVCRRLLRNPHDAEDAFQATFLVLVQKAATVVPREIVANWLHGVARQTAVRLRATAAKRGWREVQMTGTPEPAADDARDEELLSLLDQELSRLPERFRALIVLCDLEGHTRKDAARQLGCPEGTVASRLARGRELLARRLAGRGLVVPGGCVATTLSHTAVAGVPPAVVASAINVATLVAAGKAAGVISGPVATLTQGVLKTMLLNKIMTTTVAVLALGLVAIAGGSLAGGQTESRDKPAVEKNVRPPVVEKAVEPGAIHKPARKETEVAWGKEAGGLQLGLVRVPADTTAYRPGETMEFGVRVRNVSKEKITISYGRPESTPAITNTKGETVNVAMPPRLGIIVIPTEKVLQPTETFELYIRKVAVKEVLKGEAEQKGHVGTPTIRVGTGKYRIAFPEFVAGDLVRSTGEVEFEVEDGDERKLPGQKEPFTAWGKEVGGLQAGLSVRPGGKQVYRHGEIVTLGVRVRNVGKEAVTFEYVRQFLDENPPTVTDAGGKVVPHGKLDVLGVWHLPVPVSLEPGKEIELESRMSGGANRAGAPELRYELRPADGWKSTTRSSPLFVGTGKIGLQFERVLGSSSIGPIKLDPALSKLATGKLELEVEVDPAGKQTVLTPDEATRMKEGSKLTVEYRVASVTKAVLLKTSTKQDGWVTGHGPDDVCLRPEYPKDGAQGRFLSILTPNAIGQLNKAGVRDIEKHFSGKTVRVTGPIVRHDYRGRGTPVEVEIVVNDLSQLGVLD
ncbi:MAG TPA: RNA polymerase sigma factor [Urbifossiella sp.]|nr:RNA polymerase sigma factor [Urbifossiella sp.]